MLFLDIYQLNSEFWRYFSYKNSSFWILLLDRKKGISDNYRPIII